jgi:hypothetical protein
MAAAEGGVTLFCGTWSAGMAMLVMKREDGKTMHELYFTLQLSTSADRAIDSESSFRDSGGRTGDSGVRELVRGERMIADGG